MRMAPEPREHILIIKHGALGDIILASGHLKAIREHHPNAYITCLTGKGYGALLSACPFIDDVWVDTKPKPYHVKRWLALRAQLRSRPFARVYDLQTSTRSSHYFALFASPKPEWSGIGRHVSHPQTGPERHVMHTTARLNDQLRIAGITTDGTPDISWLAADTKGLLDQIWRSTLHHLDYNDMFDKRGDAIPRFALLVPGGSAHRPEKRWPPYHYATLATMLHGNGIIPVLLGGDAERDVLDGIKQNAQSCVNLCNSTSIAQIATLARTACWAVGNDTGPMHVIAAANCPSTVIFSHASNPQKSAPNGAAVTCLQQADLASLLPDAVWNTRPAGLDS